MCDRHRHYAEPLVSMVDPLALFPCFQLHTELPSDPHCLCVMRGRLVQAVVLDIILEFLEILSVVQGLNFYIYIYPLVFVMCLYF